MSNPLLDTLENRVSNAVDTIESLRTEINELREERKILEDKLQELINRMSGVEQQQSEMAENDEEDMASEESMSAPMSPFGSQRSDY